jgi:hypothetical protein
MLSTALQLIPYALVAALSPLGIAATVAVMRSGRLNALGFATGLVIGQLGACSLLVVIGAAAVPSHEIKHPTVGGLMELGLGLVLLGFAVRLKRRPQLARQRSGGRTEAALERLQHLHVLTSFVAGLLFGIGGPKRLVLSVFAAALISSAGVASATQAALVLWYGLLATVLVWAPVLAFVILGDRALVRLDAAQGWLKCHQLQVMLYSLVIIGVLLIGDGIVTLT